MRRARRATGRALILVALLTTPAAAQRMSRAAAAPAAGGAGDTLVRPTTPARSAPDLGRRGPTWWAPLASAVVPGAGQAWMGHDRFVGYLAIEAYGWLRFMSDRREGLRQRKAYRSLARRVARAYFPGDHPDGDFEYYERMEHWVESGVFDLEPGGELQPETDTETFNGAAWLLARQTFWEDPEAPPPPDHPAYQSAIEFYARRAIRPEYRWSWRNAQLEQDLFARTIGRSNTAFRRSVEDVGIITANHVLSTVDAYVAVRLSRRSSQSVGLSATVPWAPFGRPR